MKKLKDINEIYLNSPKKNKTFVLSVLFHEEISTVMLYLMNALFYFKDYNLLILISCNNFIFNLLNKTNLPENIIIVTERPDDMPIWGNVNLFEQHIKNYLYLKENKINYDYFWFSASNDVFIKNIDNLLEENIITCQQKTILTEEEITNFYNDFLVNSTWSWYLKLIEDKNTINTFIENKIIVKCNEIEGLVLPKNITEEVLDFYVENLYKKNTTKNYIMEEFYIPSYLLSKYNLDYNTFTVREKWCKYPELKNIYGEELINKINENNKYSLLYCVKTIDRNIKNPIRTHVKNIIM